MRLSIRLGFALVAFLPAIALAVAPAAVTGLEGKLLPSGEVRISWTRVDDPNVTSYRLYYSSESILESNGIYDDFTETDGPENVYVFTNPPKTSTLYVTVLAVNAADEESASFTEEVAVPLQPQSSSAPSLVTGSSAASAATSTAMSFAVSSTPQFTLSMSSSSVASSTNASIPVLQDVPKDGKLHLLLAQPLSPTQVKLMFNEEIVIEPQRAPDAFMIKDPTGSMLRIKQLVIDGMSVTVDTDTQQRGVVYNVMLSEPLQGIPNLPLDAIDRTAFFTGHEQGSAPVAPTQLRDAMHAPDVENLMLRAQAEPGGTYTVTAQWQLDTTPGDIAYIVARQSLDRGATFGDPQALQPNVAGVQIPGARGGELGLALNVVNVNGAISPGVFQTITLPGGSQAVSSAPVWGSVTSPVFSQPQVTSSSSRMSQPVTKPVSGKGGKGLPQTGAGILISVASIGGAYLGWRKTKSRKA